MTFLGIASFSFGCQGALFVQAFYKSIYANLESFSIKMVVYCSGGGVH